MKIDFDVLSLVVDMQGPQAAHVAARAGPRAAQ